MGAVLASFAGAAKALIRLASFATFSRKREKGLRESSSKKNSGMGSGASSAAWRISGSASGCRLPASSIASAKDLRHRLPVVVLLRRELLVGEMRDGRGLEALEIFGKAHVQRLAIGRRLLMGERQAAQRDGKRLRLRALLGAAGAGDQKIRADILGPDANFDRRGDGAPVRRVGGDDDLGRAALRQEGAQGVRVDRIVVDEQDALARLREMLQDRLDRRLFLGVLRDPAEPHAEADEIGAQRLRRSARAATMWRDNPWRAGRRR